MTKDFQLLFKQGEKKREEEEAALMMQARATTTNYSCSWWLLPSQLSPSTLLLLSKHRASGFGADPGPKLPCPFLMTKRGTTILLFLFRTPIRVILILMKTLPSSSSFLWCCISTHVYTKQDVSPSFVNTFAAAFLVVN